MRCCAPIKFTTWTLKYNRCAWVTIDALEAHYRRATVEAEATGSGVKLRTETYEALIKKVRVLYRPASWI